MKITKEFIVKFLEEHDIDDEEEFISQVLENQSFKEKYLSPDFIMVRESYFNDVTEKSESYDLSLFTDIDYNEVTKIIHKLKQENKRLTELNAKISKGLAAEMGANQGLQFIKQELEEKLEKIQDYIYKAQLNEQLGDYRKDINEILKTTIDPAIQSKE